MKKAFSFLVAFAMVFSLLILPANAEGEVAEMNDKKYSSIQEAIDALEDSNEKTATITLLSDSKENITIPNGFDITLYLNENVTLTDKGEHTITNNGTITIRGSGTVTNVTSGKTPLFNNGNASLNGGKFIRHDVSGNSYYTVVNQGTMKIDGAEISNDNKLASCVENGWYENSDVNGNSATLTVLSGTITGGLNAIKNDAGGVLTVNGGTITNESQYAIMNWNKATIEGGDITCTADKDKTSSVYPAAIYNNKYDDVSVGELIIKGGNLTTDKGSTYALDNRSKATISGDANLVGGSSAIQSTSKDASIVINGGTFEGKKYYGIVAKGGSTVEINGGSFKAGNSSSSSPLRIADTGTKATVTGGTFTNVGKTPGSTTAYVGSSATVIIEGGTFTGSSKYAVNNNGGNLSISGGEFSSPTNAVFVGNNAKAITTITGGTFTSESANAVLKDGTKGTLNVSGGNFSSDVSEYVIDGNKAVSNDNGTFSIGIDEESAVAKIGDYGYKTVQEAIDAAKTGETVVLLTDTQEDILINKDKDITLNLNGKTLTNVSSDTITVELGAKLTITGEGTVDNKTHAKATIFNNGEVILNGGIYDRTSETGESANVSGGNSWYTICNHGKMTINENVTVQNTGSFSSMIENGYYNYKDTNSRNGYVEGINQVNPTLTINGGTFIGGLNTVKNDDGGLLTINGGTYRNTTQASILNWNEATITGGDFECTSSTCILNGASSSSSVENDKGILNISGGTFKSTGTTVVNNFTVDTIVSVKGGTFLANNVADETVNKFIAEDSDLKVNPDTGKVSFTVTFDNDIETQYVETNGKIAKPDLSKDGYTVVWKDGDKVWDFENDVVTKNVSLKATFTPIEYKITYHVGEGGKHDNATTYTIENDDLQLKDPTRDGYDFEGWYDNENYTGQPIESIQKGSIGDKELYAKWKKKVEEEQLPTPTPDPEPTPTPDPEPTPNPTPNPVEEEKQTIVIRFAIVIDGEEIDVTEYGWENEDFELDVEKGVSISQEELEALKEIYGDFDIEDYKFKGIFLDKEGKEEVKGDVPFTEDTTLYMIWESAEPTNPSQPVDTEKPTITTDPTKPIEEVKENPEKVEESVESVKKVVKTDDDSNMVLYANVCALTMVGAAIIVLMKKKEELMR